MPKQLVFIHGRSQERMDSVQLKQTWIEAWQRGLQKSGLELPIATSEIRFPYYGDTLDQLVAGVSEEEAAKIITRRGDLERLDFITQWLYELQAQMIEDGTLQDSESQRPRGIQNWEWVQKVLRRLDRHAPGVTAATIAVTTKDVYAYLNNPRLRQIINSGVSSALQTTDESVVVAHSLGTVIVYNILRDATTETIPLLVTLGSPLGVSTIKNAVAPVKHPACVKDWLNAYDRRDVVALIPLDDQHFSVKPTIRNKADVNNFTPNRHGISGYLEDREIARQIFDAIIS